MQSLAQDFSILKAFPYLSIKYNNIITIVLIGHSKILPDNIMEELDIIRIDHHCPVKIIQQSAAWDLYSIKICLWLKQSLRSFLDLRKHMVLSCRCSFLKSHLFAKARQEACLQEDHLQITLGKVSLRERRKTVMKLKEATLLIVKRDNKSIKMVLEH